MGSKTLYKGSTEPAKMQEFPNGSHKRIPNDSEETKLFVDHLAQKGLKLTSPRLEVLEEVLQMEKHQSIEAIYESLRRKGSRVGFSTVYRTMHLLVESGIVREQDFGMGIMRYERQYGIGHHDHLVCIECGKIIEFVRPEIESLQDSVAAENKFRITGHKHEIYGTCSDCH